MARLTPWLVLVLAVGCGDDVVNETTPEGTGGAAGAAPCPVGSVDEDGTCVASGVKSCAPGFESNERGGCRAILPTAPCGAGQMALPGETRCRPVGDGCGDAPWGNIPVNETTHYVDARYRGLDSDGTAARPWRTIQDGIDATSDLVAIAAGTYQEALLFGGKPVRLWGRCPELVAIVSEPNWEAVVPDGPGAEIRNLSLSGTTGVGAYYADDVLLEDVRIHDTVTDGILSIGDDVNGPTRLIVRDSLFEQIGGAAMLLVHVEATIERSVVRDVGAGSSRGAGRGIHLEKDSLLEDAPPLVVRSSIVERTREVAIVVDGGALTLEASLVREVSAGLDGRHGVAVAVQHTAMPASIDGSVFEKSTTFGLIVANAELNLTSTTIEDVAVQPLDGEFGDAAVVASSIADATRLSIADSRLAGAARAGVGCFSAAVVVSGSALECNGFHLNGEGAFSFDDGGRNACWCDAEATDCKVLSTGIAPPSSF